jgi:hypothetical protein
MDALAINPTEIADGTVIRRMRNLARLAFHVDL